MCRTGNAWSGSITDMLQVCCINVMPSNIGSSLICALLIMRIGIARLIWIMLIIGDSRIDRSWNML